MGGGGGFRVVGKIILRVAKKGERLRLVRSASAVEEASDGERPARWGRAPTARS